MLNWLLYLMIEILLVEGKTQNENHKKNINENNCKQTYCCHVVNCFSLVLH